MISNKLQKEIEAYCKLNEIEDVDGLINKMLKQGFTVEKYGELPASPPKEKIVGVNQYKVNIKIEEEKIIEEIIIIKAEEVEGKDIYGE